MKFLNKLLLLTAVALMLSSCGNSEEKNPTSDTVGTFPVIRTETRNLTSFQSFPANIEGTVNAAVRAKVPGYITNVLVDEGEEVKQGQLLFKLETESLSQDAEAAKAAVNAAQVEVDKLRPLVEKNIISEVQLETAKAQLAQTQSTYNSITANIGYANIKSPVNGRVSSIKFRSGNLISPNDAEPLTTVSQTEEVYAFFSMNEAEYYDFMERVEGDTRKEKLTNLPEVKLVLAGNREYPHEGKIETINPQVNAQTGTVSFRATFPNPEGLLANGNTGKILVPRTYENVLVIPSKSTYEAQGRVYTFKLTEGDTVKNTLIQAGNKVDDLLIVNSGLEEGDFIVAEGVAKLRDAQRITPQQTELDSIIGNTQAVFK
ncbi:efflux RND transporter periplasmic adaptor subunit [Salegentibacter sp.]|uniref:efflux RND transporter periplasmic adaptor subunit n=1 Tax=Salegentibacter sp. TaxID=1903072 RepID=UPI00356AF8EC